MPIRAHLRLLQLAGALLLLAACGVDMAPTRVPAAYTPVVAGIDTRIVQASAEAEQTADPVAQPTTTPTISAEDASPEATIVLTRWPTPSSEQVGLRPEDTHLFRQPIIGPQTTLEWRPPPMPVPLSLHPSDHYWLSRPIPSGSRNYDLEYYPYGNDVLIAEFAPYRIHRGLDFPNPPGTPVLAAGSGTVIHAGAKPNRTDGVNYYGNTVVIKHDWQWQGQDVYTLYAHTMELFVEVGEYVEAGQLIAGVGATGIVSGPHLHLEVRIGEDLHANTRNPMLWIAPYEGWGTLAGRVIDKDGKFITGAQVSVRPINVQTEPRAQHTYLNWDLKSDDVWQENFVIGDLPAGRYELTVRTGQTFRHTIDLLPGQTNFIEIQTSYVWLPPTATPTATVPPDTTPTPEMVD